MRNLIFFLILSFSSCFLFAQDKKFIKPLQSGYSEAVIVKKGKTIYISGQTAAGASTIAKGNLALQAEQVFAQLNDLLTQAGASFKDVVKMTTFVVNYRPDALPIIREVRSKFINVEQPPASTLVGVQALFQPDVMIEIELIAVVK